MYVQFTGTSIEFKGRETQAVFDEEVVPVISKQPDLWPPAYASFDHFKRAADLVQTRAFHMMAENWVTGVTQVGVTCVPTNTVNLSSRDAACQGPTTAVK